MKPHKETLAEIEFYKAIFRCGMITDNLVPYYHVSPYMIKRMVEDENITMVRGNLVYGVVRNVYTLTRKNRDRLEAEFLIQPYKHDQTQINHDYILANLYAALSEERDTWITETTLRTMFPNAITTTDAAIVRRNRRIGVEVITSSYKKESIQQKFDFANEHFDGCIVLHTNPKLQRGIERKYERIFNSNRV